MRCFTLILALTLLYLPQLLAQSAEREPAAAFQVDRLSVSQLEGFRLKGLEKISDFAELLEKYQDTSLAPEIRNQCQTMILNLFYKEDSQLFYYNNKQQLKPIKLNQFLEKISKLNHKLVIKHPIESDTLPIQVGDTYQLKTEIELQTTNKAQKETKQLVALEVIIKKEIKSFGTEKIEIWQALLGNMTIPVRP